MSEKITHIGLGEEIASKLGLPKTKGAEFSRILVEEIAARLKKGEKVEFTGVVSLVTEKTKARTGRNPSTGKEIQIPAKNRVKVAVSQKLKEFLN
ncbi:MAG: HU family DNA-binding protein [Brevinema sp.]